MKGTSFEKVYRPAEDSGRRSSADNKRFVAIARGSLMETRHWLQSIGPTNTLPND